MKKGVLGLLVLVSFLLCEASAFSPHMTLDSWTKGTIPTGQYVNIAQITTPYGDGISVNTSGYPGAFEFNYDFFGYYNERFIVPPSGRVEVEGYFMYDDITPHLDRRHLSLYLLHSDLSGYMANRTRVLDYAHGHMPGVWYHRLIIFSDLDPGKEFMLAFGRRDLCDMDRELQASCADVNVDVCRILKVPYQFLTIQQAISEASPGDIIQIASGTYYEYIVVDKDNLKIIGESASTTIIDARVGNGSDQAVVNVTGWNVLLSGFTVIGTSEANGIVVHGENTVIFECNITNNDAGICLLADNVEIMRSNIHGNVKGVWMQDGVENCTIYYNNFFNNTSNIYCEQLLSANTWDNGYAGNFWSNYTGVDTNGDGIGDAPQVIGLENIDYYPLMSLYMCGDVNHDGRIDMKDVGFVARRFGCTRTDPLWNAHADVNEDNKVDMKDVGTTARKFGQEW